MLIDRLPKEESPLVGRSRCDLCLHKLSWLDLIPLVSFIILQGKCRYCKKFIGWKYPITEATTGLLFILTAYYMPYHSSGSYLIDLIYYIFIISILIVIFFTDLFYGIIPFWAVVLGSASAILWHLLFPAADISILNYVLSAIGSFLAFLCLFLITKRRGIGFGDVMYVFFMGLVLGFPTTILGFYIAFITGALISLILIGLKKKKMKGGTIPFGPFLVTGTFISLLWGNVIISWILPYLRS